VSTVTTPLEADGRLQPGVEPSHSAWAKISPPKREAITGVNAFDFGGVGELGQVFDLPKRPSKAISGETMKVDQIDMLVEVPCGSLERRIGKTHFFWNVEMAKVKILVKIS
jgi:hypothetical protein